MENLTKEQALEKIKQLENYIKELDNKPTPQERFLELIQKTTSIKIDNKKYPNSTLGFKNDKFLWKYDSKNGDFWISYSLIWSVLEQEFNLNEQEIKELIKDTVESHSNCKGVTPYILHKEYMSLVESHFNCTK